MMLIIKTSTGQFYVAVLASVRFCRAYTSGCQANITFCQGLGYQAGDDVMRPSGN